MVKAETLIDEERIQVAQKTNPIEVYLETGQTRTFAVALDWPGWCRSGRSESAALETLYAYGPRYAQVLRSTQIQFRAPSAAADLDVVERLTGDGTTDFGAPGQSLPGDAAPVEPGELERWEATLKACWQAFDSAVQAATGQALRKGPRGGGRELAKIVQHVRDVDIGYLGSLGGKLEPGAGKSPPEQALPEVRRAILAGLGAAVRGELPARGPRGGARWKPRYFVRRLAWHELDHAWEIEDRAE